MVRYNSDHEVTNVGTNSGFGRFEVYYKSQWTPLISLIDFASPGDIYSTGNVTLKVLADMIRDFFVQGMGLIEINQSDAFDGGSAPGHGYLSNADKDQAKLDSVAWLPESNRTAPAGVPDATPLYIDDSPYPGNTPIGAWHTNKVVQQTQPIFNPIVGDGMIYEIQVTDQGSGYSTATPPLVKITTGGGEGARISLEVEKDSLHADYGKIVSATVDKPGSGYHSSYTKVYLKGGGGKNGDITLIINAGEITGVNITNPGELYQVPPTVSVADAGTRAYAEVKDVDIVGGKVTAVTVVSRGVDYTDASIRAPVVEIVSSIGSGATAIALLGTGKVIDIEVLRGGSGYPFPPGAANPLLVITGDGASADYRIDGNDIEGGAVVSTTRYDYGSGYSPATTFAAIKPEHASSNAYVQYSPHKQHSSVEYEFDVNIFIGCGVPTSKKGDYKISLFNSLYKAITRYGHINGNTGYGNDYLQTVKMVPKWDVTVAAPWDTEANYGIYKCRVFLHGVKPYYSAACGAVWYGSLTKWRNF
tara:strand:+ start:11659 stop:13251 length:1593 start_codon:yes stop_codon:yes gene_type:complete